MRLLLLLTFFLSSCSMYKRDFDCPPGEGISCTPVTTLERMVVESSSGPDIFLGCVPKLADIQNIQPCCCVGPVEQKTQFQRRIWIAPINGLASYVYFEEELPCEER